MRRISQYCPIARATELLGDRWTLLLVRDLLGGSTRFNELARGLPGLSRGLLAKRLRQMERAELVARDGDRYLPTPMGRALWPVLEALGGWGATWTLGDPRPEDLDPDLLMWWLHRHVPHDGFPDRRVNVSFQLTDARRRYWILISREQATLCVTDPGFDPDVTVVTTTAALYRIWQGRSRTAACLSSGQLELTGPGPLRHGVRAWLDGGPLVPLVEPAPA